ncbi:MAG TPA: Maf family nucleotide pyrophosphatase [Stellaceae bacterium]|jgi:septum formation protein|nr:Maf family nucleotide pyrophosphatase [Stellaceae bacterium]
MASTPEATRPGLILASASSARAALLRQAGVEFAADPADIDEAAIKRRYRDAGGAAEACAMALAVAKAKAVAARRPDAIVVGADQLLVAGDDWFDKPHDLAEATAHLRRLRGREHALVTAACAVQGDAILWQAMSTPRLTMRRFGEAFLAGYIAAEGDAVLGSVGAYRIEGRGVQLFARIEGDYFAILGLPLIELLGFLRERGLVGA